METPLTVLSYADSPVRGELCVEQRDDGMIRVIVPPARDWRLLPVGYKAAAVGLLGVMSVLLLGAVRAADGDDSRALCVNAAFHAVFLAILIAAAHQRMYRSLIFEVTPAALSITHVAPNGLRSARLWRRSAVKGVRTTRDGDNLIVRISGRDDLHMFIGPRATTVAAADALNAALTALPAGDAGGDPSPVAAEQAAPGTDNLRPVFLWLAGGLALLGLGIGFFGDLCLAVYVLLLAAVPLALAWGTREKDFRL